MNGASDEVYHVYVVRRLTPAAEAESDDTEAFELVRVRADEVEARIRSGAIWDGMGRSPAGATSGVGWDLIAARAPGGLPAAPYPLGRPRHQRT
jgi:hypothetical protein